MPVGRMSPGGLALDYNASETSVATTVDSLLQAAYASNFASGQIRDSSATSSVCPRLLQCRHQQVTIMPARRRYEPERSGDSNTERNQNRP